ncbi:MAG: hypothetical protein KTR31_16080 [Myxococcales bacterium]|nr:hypothetical protein [Myxococcales bacterium]
MRRRAASRLLLRRTVTQGALQLVFMGLLSADLVIAFGLVTQAASASHGLTDLVSRLFGDAEEAAWLGWVTYFGWLFYSRISQARRTRKRAQVARLLLRRGHPRWFVALQ